MALPHPSPLTKFRESKKWSLGDLAVALGCGRSHLSRVERGETKASPELANRIEILFKKKITRDQVLYPEDYMPAERKPARSAELQETR